MSEADSRIVNGTLLVKPLIAFFPHSVYCRHFYLYLSYTLTLRVSLNHSVSIRLKSMGLTRISHDFFLIMVLAHSVTSSIAILQRSQMPCVLLLSTSFLSRAKIVRSSIHPSLNSFSLADVINSSIFHFDAKMNGLQR